MKAVGGADCGVWQVSYEVVPHPANPEFFEVIDASVSCWVSRAEIDDPEEARAFVLGYLAENLWQVADVEDEKGEEVRLFHRIERAEWLEMYDEAIECGACFCFYVMPLREGDQDLERWFRSQ